MKKKITLIALILFVISFGAFAETDSSKGFTLTLDLSNLLEERFTVYVVHADNKPNFNFTTTSPEGQITGAVSESIEGSNDLSYPFYILWQMTTTEQNSAKNNSIKMKITSFKSTNDINITLRQTVKTNMANTAKPQGKGKVTLSDGLDFINDKTFEIDKEDTLIVGFKEVTAIESYGMIGYTISASNAELIAALKDAGTGNTSFESTVTITVSNNG